MRSAPLVQSLTTVLLAAAALPASAAPILSLYDDIGDPQSTTVPAGTPFAVTLRVEADRSYNGFSLFLTDPGYTSGTRFTLASRTSLPTNPFTDPNTADTALTNSSISTRTKDLGFTTDDAPAAVGTYDLMTLTISPAASLAPGPYTLTLTPQSVLIDAAYDDVSYATLPQFRVNVVATPEPAALIGGSLLAALLRRRPLVRRTPALPS